MTLLRLSVFPISVVGVWSVDPLPNLTVIDEKFGIELVSFVVCLCFLEVVSDRVLRIVVDFLIRVDVIVHTSLNLQV